MIDGTNFPHHRTARKFAGGARKSCHAQCHSAALPV
jgi:hypothetical protein